jgi:cytochrome c-type biogenesis protein CcmE
MNRRARKRLLVATLVLVVVFAVAVVWVVRSQGVYYRQVGGLTAADDGKTVKVGGTVVESSLSHDAGGYHFSLSDLTGAARTVQVLYAGQVPDACGAGVDVVVVGRYDARGQTIAADELQTKCPSKYKTSASPSP